LDPPICEDELIEGCTPTPACDSFLRIIKNADEITQSQVFDLSSCQREVKEIFQDANLLCRGTVIGINESIDLEGGK